MVKTYDFNVMVTSRHEELNDQLKSSAVEEILRLSRYHNHIIDGDLTIDKKNSSYKAEMTLRVPGHVFVATAEEYDVAKAIDSAIDKTKTQLKKLKSKIVDHRASHQVDFVIPVEVEADDKEPEQES